jgi:hypothetical protein
MASAPALAQTGSTLQLLDVRLGKRAVVGRETSVVVDAVDSRAAVNGMVVRFGRRGSVFGISACRLPDSTGALPGPPFAPGSRVRLKVRTGSGTSAGCSCGSTRAVARR